MERLTQELEKAVLRRQTVELMATELKKELARQKFSAFKVRLLASSWVWSYPWTLRVRRARC
jgi:hypothetical protein